MKHWTLWTPSCADQDFCEGRWQACSFGVRLLRRHSRKSCRFACAPHFHWRSIVLWIFVVQDLEMCTEVGREGMEESWALGNPHWWRGRNAVKARGILFLVIQSQSYSILKLVINKRSPALKLKINITNIIIKIKFLNRSNIFLMMLLQYFKSLRYLIF